MRLYHQGAVRVKFADKHADKRSAILLLSSLADYYRLFTESQRVFARKYAPDYLLWHIHEPIVLDPPKALYADLSARGSSDLLYASDLQEMQEWPLCWPKPLLLYVGRWDGALIKGRLDGQEFVSDPLQFLRVQKHQSPVHSGASSAHRLYT